MARDLPIGNGHLLVNHDLKGNIRCIYYPHIGHENHALDHLSRFGAWVDGEFFWLDNPEMHIDLHYQEETLIANLICTHPRLGIELHIEDSIDHHENVFMRHVSFHNHLDRRREVRLFFHLDLNLYGSQIANTVLYYPELDNLIFYKGHRYVSLSAGIMDPKLNVRLDGFACGQKGIHGLLGTWKDAEDGHLEQGPIAQGSVDGTIQLNLQIEPNKEADGWFWFCFGKSLEEVETLETSVRTQTPKELMRRTHVYWQHWIHRDKHVLDDLPERIASAYRKSLLIIRTNMDHDGAIIAANDSSMLIAAQDSYSYMWPRDGALIAHSLDRAGYHDLTRTFFDFCKRALTPAGYLMHKYNPDGSVGASWLSFLSQAGEKQLPIQEDETALVLYALWNHHEVAGTLDESLDDYEKLIVPAADFLVEFRDLSGLPKPSYDLWEERMGVFAFTSASVYTGLMTAAQFAAFHDDLDRQKKYSATAEQMRSAITDIFYDSEEERFARAVYPKVQNGELTYERDMEPDSSLYALFDFGILPPEDSRIRNTMSFLKGVLWVDTPIGGMARYRGDAYYSQAQNDQRVPGNPWFICTLWYAEWKIACARTNNDLKEAERLLEWAVTHSLASGIMAEQIHPYTGEPLSVSPLTWSHATFIKVVQEYMTAKNRISKNKQV